MSDGKRPLQRLSTGLIAAGIVLLVAVGGYLIFNQLRGTQSRQALRQTTPVAETSVPTVQATALPATALPATPSSAATVTPTLTVSKPTQPAITAPPSPEPPLPTLTPVPAMEEIATAPVSTATSIASATLAVASVPIRLVIPDLKIDVPVVEMGWRVVQTAGGPRSDWVIPKNEAGHHINSALLGDEGNLVISGHNNIYGEVLKPISFAWDSDTAIQVDNFTDRSDLLNGRTVELFDATGQAFKYTVSAFYRLKDTGVSLQQRIANGRFMEPTGQAQVTIITCWPPTSNTHRLVLVAVPATN